MSRAPSGPGPDGEIGQEPERPCRLCRWWDPRVLNDSFGIIRGICYCAREQEEDYDCFEAVEDDGERK